MTAGKLIEWGMRACRHMPGGGTGTTLCGCVNEKGAETDTPLPRKSLERPMQQTETAPPHAGRSVIPSAACIEKVSSFSVISRTLDRVQKLYCVS